MQNTWNRFKNNAAAIGTFVGILVVLGGGAKFAVIDPIHQRFDAIDQHFNTIDQRFGDLRAEMNARFDTQDKHVNQRLNDQNRNIRQGFDTVNQRFDAQDKYINQRFDDQDRRLQQLENDMSELRKLNGRVSRNEDQINTLKQQLQTADAPSP